MLGWFAILVGLTALIVIAALALASRARPAGRAETVIATSLVANFLVLVPIYALGLTGALSRWSLILGALITAALALALAARGRGWRALAREARAVAAGVARAPGEVLAAGVRARSLATIGIAFGLLLIVYNFFLAYLAPSWRAWDALWYHEPMVGYAIQNHGFAMVDLPASAQKLNGYPRACEMTQLWFAMLLDRRLIDLPNTLLAPCLILSVYVLARRQGASQVLAAAWGALLLQMPDVRALLQSTYVDSHAAAFVLGAVVFATRRELRIGDVWLTIVALTLAVGAKILCVVPVALVSGLMAVRCLRAWRRTHERRWLIAVLAGGALIAAMAASTYLRNYVHFKNPLWPDLHYENARLGIHWPGAVGWSGLSLNEPVTAFVGHLFSLPYSINHHQYHWVVQYGLGVSWVVFPLGLVAAVACTVAWVRARVRRRRAAARAPAETLADGRDAVWIAILAVTLLVSSPMLWTARYQIVAVGLLMVLTAWLGARPGWDRLGEGAVSTVVIASLMMFWWQPAGEWITPRQAWGLLSLPYPAREFEPAFGAPVTMAAGLARERELGDGAVLAFDDDYGAYLALFWNNRFSNRAVYLPSGPDFLARAQRIGAIWVYVNLRDPLLRTIQAPGSGWEEVGFLSAEKTGKVFRRKTGPLPP